MLAVTTLRSSTPGDRAGDVGATNLPEIDDFSVDFDIDFSELFAGFDDAQLLPGLEVEPSETGLVDLLALETASTEVEMMESAGGSGSVQQEEEAQVAVEREEMVLTNYEEVLSCEKKEVATGTLASEINSSAPEGEKGRKSSEGPAKGSNGKRKVKVDWTTELHRRFVQAVEQLGVEKAVPSRILELMGIDSLTRHNVASHLQKYRSHRKHTMVREGEAACWSQRGQAYGTASAFMVPKREISPWLAPTVGFPPNALPPPPPHHHHDHPHMKTFRPLHVWGHPTMDQSLVHMWPKHIFPIRPTPSPPWVAPLPIPPPALLQHGSPWPTHFAGGTLTQGMPYFPQPLPTLRFPAPPVPGIPPHPMYRPDGATPAATPPPSKQAGWLLQLDAHPSKESIDAALGDVLAQPWLPLPLGLKPPSLESVMVELQKQGISNVPPCN